MPATSTKKKQRFAINSLFSAFSWVLPIFLAFIATPIMVKSLGSELYGIYALIAGFLAYSFGIGIGRGVIKFVSEFRASDKSDLVADVVAASLVYSVILGVAGGLVLVLCTPYIVRNILLIPAKHETAAIVAFYFASISILAALISQVFQSALQGMNEFGTFLAISNLLAILLSVGNISLVLLGFGVEHLQAWSAACLIVGGIGYYLAYRHKYRNRPLFQCPNADIRKVLARFSINIIVYQFIGNSIYFFERTWVTRTFGIEELAHYAIAMLLAFYLHGCVGSFAMVLFPTINELIGSPKRQIELYKRSLKVILAVIVFTVTAFIVGGKNALFVWLSPEIAEAVYPLLVIHALSVGILALMIVTWQLNEGYAAARLNVFISVVWAVVGIPTMIVLSGHWNAEGVALGRLAAMAASIPFMFYAEYRFLGAILGRFWFAASVRLIAATFAMVLILRISLAGTPSWSNLFLSGIVSAAVFAVVLYAVRYLSREDFAEIRALFSPRSLRMSKEN